MQQLHGSVKRFDWGTTDAIPALLGMPADGGPVSEYWLGAHEAGPSLLGDQPLGEVVGADPRLLGVAGLRAFGPKLPYLVKLLSARHPLSIQAHPDRDHAREGFAREVAAGLAPDDPRRIYRDDWPKPELFVALGEVDALVGFRDPLRTAELFAALGVNDHLDSVIGPLVHRSGSAALAEVFLDVLSLDQSRLHLLDEVAAAAVQHASDEGAVGDFARTVIQLDERFPADPGILAALLLNRVRLAPCEGVYVPPGTMHIYLRGDGIEIAGNSDNVVRGGLTSKHIDVEELIRVVDFDTSEPQFVAPQTVGPGLVLYPTPCPEFDLWRAGLRPSAQPVNLPGVGAARIAFVTGGHADFNADDRCMPLRQGQAAFFGAHETSVTLTGDADVFIAAPGLR